MCSGIKQGAIESPAFFGIVAGLCYADAECRFSWDECDPKLPLLPVREVLYMDDSVAWGSDQGRLLERISGLVMVMAEWGLFINPGKCQWYRSSTLQGGRCGSTSW